MDASTKIELIKKMVGDFWDFNSSEAQTAGAEALVAAIYSVASFDADAEIRGN